MAMKLVRNLLKIIMYCFGGLFLFLSIFIIRDESTQGIIMLALSVLIIFLGWVVSHPSKKELEREEFIKEKARKAKIIKGATIIGSDSKSKTSSAIGRAVVGDFVAGGVGSIVGASTAKKDGMTKFLVEFADGHKSVETVKDNSPRFQELIKYVQM